jgi:hypothetical protein
LLSWRAILTRPVFSVRNKANERESPESPAMRKVEMSPDDEILLTELTFDNKDMITYEISSVILVAEREQANPYGKFRCFMDSTTKEFFIEIPNEGTMNAFTQSALLNILGLAEEAGAETVYICIRKTVKKQEAYLRNFLFIGFEKLTENEQKKISMTKTHGILKCALKSEEDDE